MWTPILKNEDLPAVGARERAELDFKVEYGPNSFEVAKDVAALANSHGGTILVGAAGGDNLSIYRPLAPDAAKQCARAVEEAVRDRCRPGPLYSIEQLVVEQGLVVAINVWPMPGQLVGVRIKKSELMCGPNKAQPEDVFLFPVRVGTHTKNVMPEQVAMFLDAKVRRVAIGLERAVGQRVVLLTSRSRDAKTIHVATATVKAVELLDNVVELVVDGRSGPADVAVPLDSIASVCHSSKGWHIYMDGWIKPVEWLDGNPDELMALDHFFDPLG